MSKVMYEVWSEDTYARKNYRIGQYGAMAEAEKVLLENEKKVLNQCETLRDTFWIVEITPEEELARREREREWDEWRRKRREFDRSHLRELVKRLNDRLVEITEQDKQGLIADAEVSLGERNGEVKDCYSFITYRYLRQTEKRTSCSVYIKIRIGNEGSMFSACFSGTLEQIQARFSFTEGETFVCEFIEEMILDYFEG